MRRHGDGVAAREAKHGAMSPVSVSDPRTTSVRSPAPPSCTLGTVTLAPPAIATTAVAPRSPVSRAAVAAPGGPASCDHGRAAKKSGFLTVPIMEPFLGVQSVKG